MRSLGWALPIVFVASISASSTHAQELAPVGVGRGTDIGVSILSNTNGVSLDPYMKGLISDLRTQWRKQVTDRGLKSGANSEPSVVDLTIGADGRLLALRLEKTENTAFDRAAWESAKSTHYAALPCGMKDSELKLSVEFFAN